jgi:hypothetical protein
MFQHCKGFPVIHPSDIAASMVALSVPAIFAANDVLGDTSISGGVAGWTGAGIVGAVLSWLLLKHLPSQQASYEKQLESKDKNIAEMMAKIDRVIEKHDATETKAREDFRDCLQEVTDHCQKELSEICAAIKVKIG